VTSPTTAPRRVAPGRERRSDAGAPVAPPATGVARRRRLPRLTPARVVLCCAAAAVISTVVAPTPSYDPWAWIIWGRELAGLSDLGFSTASATGWKPLPVLVTTPLSLLGTELGPAAWVALVRTAALLALVLAARLAHRAAGRGAAIAAVALLLASPQALELVTGGASEAIVLLALLYGIERHLDGRRGAALAAGIVACLARPETAALVLPYAVWVWRGGTVPRWRIAAGVGVLPLLWIGGDWLGTGRPFLTFGHATSSIEPNRVQDTAVPGLELLAGTTALVALVVVALAVAGIVDSVRRREPVGTALGVALGTLALPLAVMTELGYPGVPRYLSAPAALAGVLAAIALARGARAMLPRPHGRAAVALGAAGLAALVVLAGAPGLRGSWAQYTGRVRLDRALPAAIAAAGGRTTLLSCGRPVIRPAYLATDLAYRLDVPMRDVNSGGGAPAVVLFPRKGASWRGFTQSWGPWLALARIARTRDWDVYQLRDAWTRPCAAAAAGNLGPVTPDPVPAPG